MVGEASPFRLKWGIMATGWMAEFFCKDLLTNPACRDVSDVRHEIVAVASSTVVDKSVELIKRIGGAASARLYGSYAELVADADVDIVYVATPHSHHFQNAMLALQAGKNVLCEKALTVNSAQAKKLVQTARDKKLFFMAAVWTRFFPLSIKIREMITAGEIGIVYRTIADLSLNESSDGDDGSVKLADTHRLVNKDLAGGALLDLGVYALTWVFQTLYHVQKPKAGMPKERPLVRAAVSQYRTGADESSSIICHFPTPRSTGIATTSMLVATSPDDTMCAPAVRIQGSKGEIQVAHPCYQPTEFKVIKNGRGGKTDVIECPIPKDPKLGGWGRGMFWEADECARCIRDGREQSDTLPWEESILIMEMMEAVLAEGGVTYPELITSDVFDATSPLNSGRTRG